MPGAATAAFERGRERKRGKGMKANDIDYAAIAADYRGGLGVPRLVEKFGVSPSLIYYALGRENVVIRPVGSGAIGRRKTVSDDVVRDAYRQHGNLREAAAAVGMSLTGVHARLVKMGEPRRRRGDTRKAFLQRRASALADAYGLPEAR